MKQEITRRAAVGSALALLSTKTMPATVTPSGRPLTEDELKRLGPEPDYLSIGLCVPSHLAFMLEAAEPACPGVSELVNARLAELQHELVGRFPQLNGPLRE